MRVTVDERCTACGLCAETCPEVFALGEGAEIAQVIADPVPAGLEDACRQAVDGCPVEAIEIVEE